MLRDEAVVHLQEEFGEVRQRVLSDGFVLVDVGPLPIAGGSQETRVAMKLAEQFSGVPEIFVETHVTLNSGGSIANESNVDIEGDPWKRWSFKTEWNPQNHTITQLVHATLSRFDR